MDNERMKRFKLCSDCGQIDYDPDGYRCLVNGILFLNFPIIPLSCPLEKAPPRLGDCEGCIYNHPLIFSSRCQKCLRSNGIVDYYILTKKE